MVDRAIFLRRLDALNGYLQKLKAFQHVERTEFASEPALYDLAERYLHLVMECVLDLANHTIADRDLGTPATNRDCFTVLEKAGEISPDLAGRLRQWAGFRNILVHQYLEVDHGLSHQVIAEDLGDIQAFLDWALSVVAAEEAADDGNGPG